MVQNSPPTDVIEPLDIPILLRSWLGRSGQECYIIEEEVMFCKSLAMSYLEHSQVNVFLLISYMFYYVSFLARNHEIRGNEPCGHH